MKIKLRDNIEMVPTGRNVVTLYINDVGSGFELPILLRADAHRDHIDCDRALEKQHLEEIKEKNGLAADFGDLFDACGGRFDPRRSYSNLRPEYKVDNYLDKLVEDHSKFYGPYAQHFIVMATGNHESSILENNGVDLTDNLVHRLNVEYNGHVQRGGYGGYIRFVFNSGKSQTIVLKYFHGALGSNSISVANRQSMMYPDADIIINGHNHSAWYMPIARERISERGAVSTDIQHHIRTASYVDHYKDGNGGWFVERGNTPRPRGAVMLRFYFKNHKIETEVTQLVK